MTNYDIMSFKELVQSTIEHSFDGTPPPDDWLNMLRKAVIREASVGTLTCHVGMLGQTYGDKPITSFNEGDRYALVLLPKETTL